MDPITTLLFTLFSSATYDGIKKLIKSSYPDHIADKISDAFTEALKKWTPNEELREAEKKTLDEKILLLKEQIDKTTNPQDIDEETQSLLDLFRVELMSNLSAYPFLEELHWDKNETDLAKINLTTQEILSYIKPQKAQFYVDFPLDYFIKGITPNQHYIPRKIQNALENNETIAKLNLISLIEENKTTNIVVLASAGMGKTEELKQTAITLANQESKYPIFVSFSKFTADKDIVNYLPDTWINVPLEKLVLLFDGFDELIDNQINIIQRKLILFIENHPKITIVISCRINFYHLAINGNSETLKGFKAYYLQALTYEDVVNYVSNHHSLDGSLFMNAVYQKQFDDLIYNPFFLQILIPDFKRNNAFSGNRTQLFQKFIKERLSWDKEHFATSFSLNDEEERALELLRKVSIAMEMLGSRNIDSKDLHTLISDKLDFELIKHCTVFNKEEGLENWKFEHNNFQEILCAEKLAELPFETVINLIGFKGYNKIQPSWVNTVSFLISLVDENDKLFQPLIDWIVSNDPEVLVKVEKERIPQKIRIEIFIRIFNYYKELNIWINSNNFSRYDLARFAESNEMIDFLMSEILSIDNQRRVRLNGINILLNVSFDKYPDKGKIKNNIFELLRNEDFDSNTIYYLIRIVEQLGFHDERTIDELLLITGSNNSSYVRAAFYSIINESGLFDKYIDYYMFGLIIDSNQNKKNVKRDRANSTSEERELFSGIARFHSYSSLETFFNAYKENLHYFDRHYHFSNTLDKLIDNCIAAYKEQPKIWRIIFDIYLRLKDSFKSNVSIKFLRFFEQTKTKSQVIDGIIEQITSISVGTFYKMFHLSEFIDERALNKIIMSFKSGLITIDNMNNLYYSIRQNGSLQSSFFNKFYEETNIRLNYIAPVDWDVINKERLQEGFNILFDINQFKFECFSLFEDKRILSKEDFDKKFDDNNYTSEIIYNDSVLRLILDLFEDNEAKQIEVVEDWFKNRHIAWDHCIYYIYDILKNDSDKLIISDIQISAIHEWFNVKIESINFKMALKVNGSMDSNAVICVFFMQKFKFECREEILLDMLSFTFHDEYLKQDYILERVDSEKVALRIETNLRDGMIFHENIFENHAKFVFQNHLLNLYRDVFKYILDKSFDDYYDIIVVDLYFENNSNPEFIKSVIDKFTPSTQIHILEKLLKLGDVVYVTDKLGELHDMDVGLEDEMKINNLLISCKNIEGLKFSINWIEKYKISPFSQHGQRLAYFESIETLPSFLILLELSYSKEVKIGNQLDTMLSIVLEGIYYLAIQSETNFNEVCLKLKEFIEVNKGKLEEVEFLNATIERIKEKFFQTHSVKYSIREIKNKIALLYI